MSKKTPPCTHPGHRKHGWTPVVSTGYQGASVVISQKCVYCHTQRIKVTRGCNIRSYPVSANPNHGWKYRRADESQFV